MMVPFFPFPSENIRKAHGELTAMLAEAAADFAVRAVCCDVHRCMVQLVV